MKSRLILISILGGVLAGCASLPTPDVRRQADLNHTDVVGGAQTSPLNSVEQPETGPQAVIRRGNGQMINRSAAAAPLPNLGGATTGSATFNFEGESVHAVVKAILGDMLGQNYVIAPGVQGTVTLGTPKPVSPAEAYNLLEMVLGWNNARLVYSGGRYNIIPADQALAGTVAPRTGPAANARGFEVRVVPLRFISAGEMKKVLEPYARPNAIVNIDATRNVITLAGSRTELENYLRTVEIFDVDWLKGMSVGVFPLQSGRATKVVADLEKVFGENSKTPSAGMFRFMPLEGTNSVLVITPQSAYLDQIQDWLERIDSAGEGPRLFSYELKYVKAKDLADRLSEVFGGSSSGNKSGDGNSNVSLMPGTDPVQIKDGENGGSVDFGGSSDSSGGSNGGGSGLGSGSLSLNQRSGGNGSVTLEVGGDRVGVAAVDETNTLLVRSSSAAWKSIKEVIEKLDVMPMQVHIEAQIAEVSLKGDLSYGVNWFFERAVTDAGLPSAVGRDTWSAIAGNVTGSPVGGVGTGLAWTFLGRNAAAIISALDQVTDVRLLQTPSIFVRNNAEATLNVGSRIPISSVTVTGGISDNTYSQVQYLETGIILKVRPRVTRDGMVFLDIVQEVSTPGDIPDQNGNVRINTRKVKTEVGVQAGDTIMLAGLISDGTSKGSTGFPGLSRLPIVGGLFGRQTTTNDRNEVILLLTPTLVSNPQEARDLTDEYGQKFRALDPLHQPKKKVSPISTLPVILLPVGVDDDALDACLAALDLGTPSGTRVWLADDAQAGPRATAIIERWLKKTPLQADYTRRQQMIGEVAHLDEMLTACAGADVVVLAPDAQPLPGWLQEISACFARDASIASATPWCNVGEAASWPRLGEITPPPHDVERMASACAAMPPVHPELPSAVNHAVALRGSARKRAGGLDVSSYASWYAALIDLSLRMSGLGWRNALCETAFVARGGEGIPADGDMDTLNARWPAWHARLASFLMQDPLREPRERLAAIHADIALPEPQRELFR